MHINGGSIDESLATNYLSENCRENNGYRLDGNYSLKDGCYNFTLTVFHNSDESNVFFDKCKIPTAELLGLKKDGYLFLGWGYDRYCQSYYNDPRFNYLIHSDGEFWSEIPNEVYAIWGKTFEYTINFDANGGSICDSTSMRVKDASVQGGKISTTLPSAESLSLSREGYTFKGWAKSPSATSAEYKNCGMITISSNITLYAVWAYNANYTINFDSNGGNIISSSQVVKGETETVGGNISTNLKTSSSVGLNRSGYKFMGWTGSPSSQSVLYRDGSKITISGDITLYAVWDKIVSYTITFNANGGYISKTSQIIEGTENAGATGVLASMNTSRSGYVLAGWSIDSNASYATFADCGTISIKRNLTLYAVWTLPTYTITYKVDNGWATSSTTRTVTGEQTITLPTISSLGLSKSGYDFLYWKTSGSTSCYYEGNSYKVSEDITFYGVWKEKPAIYVALYHPKPTSNMYGPLSATIGAYSIPFSGDYTTKEYTTSYYKIQQTGNLYVTTICKKRNLTAINGNAGITDITKSRYYTFTNGGYYLIDCTTGSITKTK